MLTSKIILEIDYLFELLCYVLKRHTNENQDKFLEYVLMRRQDSLVNETFSKFYKFLELKSFECDYMGRAEVCSNE